MVFLLTRQEPLLLAQDRLYILREEMSQQKQEPQTTIEMLGLLDIHHTLLLVLGLEIMTTPRWKRRLLVLRLLQCGMSLCGKLLKKLKIKNSLARFLIVKI